jgi:hypothetical protein
VRGGNEGYGGALYRPWSKWTGKRFSLSAKKLGTDTTWEYIYGCRSFDLPAGAGCVLALVFQVYRSVMDFAALVARSSVSSYRYQLLGRAVVLPMLCPPT